MEANKTAKAQRKIESRKIAAHGLSQETEKEQCSQPSSSKCIRRNPATGLNDNDLDKDKEALARRLPPVINSRSLLHRWVDSDEEDQSKEREREHVNKNNEHGCLLLETCSEG
ncbi:hypothetical protein BDR04DRAFT_1162727 [Suillus decipiens]|nr:hypothetical protein BDR04DRAFT_1162727 [Suillus decipiens]